MFGIHKDKSPLDTVKSLRDTFEKVGIFPVEENWSSFSRNCVSTNIKDISFHKISSNGKGINKEYALASAYAELAERLQNDFLIESSFGIKKSYGDFKYYPDEKKLKFEDLLKNDKDILNSLFPSCEEELKDIWSNEDIICLPFYDVFSNKYTYIPRSLLVKVVGSNGMCAGNSPKEAIVQGVCEIFERYAIIQIIHGKYTDVPTISDDEISNLSVFNILTEIRNRGYKAIVKDFSLGGQVPVVAVLVMDKDNTLYKVSVGSDPIFETAIQRCLTEIFQGLDGENFEESMLPLDFKKRNPSEEVVLAFKDASGHYPQSIFLKNNKPKHSSIFLEKHSDNKSNLEHLLTIAKRLGRKIYIRDNSYLGFSTYHVYIPQMSELYSGNHDLVKLLLNDEKKEKLKNITCNLLSASKDEIKYLLDYLKEYYKRSSLSAFAYDIFSDISSIIIHKTSKLNSFNSYLGIFILSYYLKDFKGAYKYLKMFVDKTQADVSYWSVVLFYLKMRIENYDNDKIKSNLINLFGEDSCAYILKKYDDTNKILEDFAIPSCPDCDVCKINKDCHFDDWDKIQEKIFNAKSNYFKEKNLDKTFKGLRWT